MPADTGATLYAYDNVGLGPHVTAYTEVAVPTPETSGNTAWQYNGKAVISGDHVSLADPADAANAAGSVVYKTVVPVDALDITFTLFQGGGGGADGAALAFFDPAVELATALGGVGGGLGILGRQVAALSFDEYNAQVRWDTSTSGAATLTHVQSVATANLHNDTSVWRLTMAKQSAGSYAVTVRRNGTTFAQWTVPCTDTAYVGFTGADGAILDAHQISAVTMRGVVTALPGDATQAAETYTSENGGLGTSKQSARVLQTAVGASEGDSATFANPVLPGRYVVVGIRDYFNYANECHYAGDGGSHVLPVLVNAGIFGVSLYGGYITDTNVTTFTAFATGSGGEIAEVVALEIAGLDGTAPTAVGPSAGGVNAQQGQLVIGFDANNPSVIPNGWTLLGQRYDATNAVGVTAAMMWAPGAGAYAFGSTVLFPSRELDVTTGSSLETYANSGLAVSIADNIREAYSETYVNAQFERIASFDAVTETYENTYRPPNDTIATAWIVDNTTTSGTETSIDLSQYHNEAGDPVTGSAWWKWQPGSGSCYTTTVGSNTDMAMEVYSGPANATSLSQLSPILFNDDYPGLGAQARVDFTGDNATWFYIVAGRLGTGGTPFGTLVFNWNGPAYIPPTPVIASATLQRHRSSTGSPLPLQTIPAVSTMQRQRPLQASDVTAGIAAASATLQRTRSWHSAAAAYGRPINDDFQYGAGAEIVLTGLAGSVGYTTIGATMQLLEPDLPAIVSGPAGTVWFTWQPDAAVHAVLSTTPAMTSAGPNMGLEVFVAPSDVNWTFDELVPLGSAPVALGGTTKPTVEWDARVGEMYFIRAFPLVGGQDPDNPVLTWSTTPLPIDLTVVNPLLTNTPTFLQVNVANEAPGAILRFFLDNNPTMIEQVTVDDTGTASYVQVPVPSLSNGVHLVVVRDNVGRVGNGVFTVAQDVLYYPTPPPPPPPPPFVLPPDQPVRKWRLQDPATGEIWDFPINPTTHDSTNLPRTLTPATTTALQGGQPIVFEGAIRARAWTFEGRVLTLDDRDMLDSWKRPYRLYLADDFGRVFIVKINSVQMTPQLDTNHPEQHTYTVNCLLYGKVQ